MCITQAITALIADPSRWAAGDVEARDAAGAAVEAMDPSARVVDRRRDLARDRPGGRRDF